MDLLTTLLLAVLCLVVFYILYSGYQAKSYFESRGIRFLGDNGALKLLSNAVFRVQLLDDVRIQYDKLSKMGVRFAGITEFGKPSLWVQDPDLLKAILVKDFDHFADRRDFPFSKHDKIFERMLFFTKGDPWKALRTKLSPTFTTGKIKRLNKLMDQSGRRMVTFIAKETEVDNEIDLTDIYSKYTMDVIASVACGYDSKAFDQKEPSLFEEMGNKMRFNFGVKAILRIIVTITATRLANLLGLSFFEKEVTDFFDMAIKKSIKERQETGVKKDDFIQLLLDARDGKLGKDETQLGEFEKAAELKGVSATNNNEVLDDDTIVANCVLFILGGFDTTQSLLMFCAYLLALNQDIQGRLRGEIDKVLGDNGGELTYDGMNSMVYLDMALQETMRFYPPMPFTDRGCTQDYKIPGTNFTLKKGQGIIIPTYGLHHDPEFFPEPEKFDPERFSPENKPSINQYAFLPFGQGPRNCIGMRFAMAEVKVAIIHLVHNFKIEPSKRTMIPMKFINSNTIKPDGGMFLSLTKVR